MRQILSAVAVAVVAVALAAWSGGDGLVTGSKAVGDGNQTTAPSGTDSPAGFSSMPSLLASVGLTHLAAAVVVVYLVKVSRPHLFDMLEDVHPYEPPSEGPRLKPTTSQLPPFPNGWYRLCDSHMVPKGGILPVTILAQEVVAFRGKSGQVSVIDAYCPHLGANLGIEGTVVGDRIRCAFHGWEFNADGVCEEIPYCDGSIPAQAKVKTWTSMERNGQILVWFHADDVEPDWEVPALVQFEKYGFIPHGRTQHTVRAHIREIPENGPDVAHLNILHRDVAFHAPVLENYMHHEWAASWEPGTGDEAHLAHIKVSQKLNLFGIYVPGSDVKTRITQVGPSIVMLELFFPVGQMVVMQGITPIDGTYLRATHSAFTSRMFPRVIAKFLLQSLSGQFQKDLPIWDNKTIVKNALVVKGDGPIPRFRRWYNQFYSESSEARSEQLLAANQAMDW